MARTFLVAAAGVAAAFMSTAASAQPYGLPYPNPYYEGRSGFGAPPRYCEKLCVQDTSPCDSPEYKRADGRCTDPLRRF